MATSTSGGKLSAEYIRNHLNAVHTPESWARALIEQALLAAASEVGTRSVNEQAVSLELKVSAFEPAGCVRICGTINGVTICYHANV